MRIEARNTSEIKNETTIFFTDYCDITFCLIDDNDEILAIATADNITEIDDDTDGIEIHNLGVIAEGRGYASTLIKMLQGKFDWLEAHEILESAIGFWEKMGFEIDQDAEIGTWWK